MRLARAPAIAATLLTSLPPAVAAPSGADDVRALAARKAAVIALMHEKAKRARVTAAQDRVFAEYFGIDAPEEKARLKARIDQVALGVQARFQVAEMCLIAAAAARSPASSAAPWPTTSTPTRPATPSSPPPSCSS